MCDNTCPTSQRVDELEIALENLLTLILHQMPELQAYSVREMETDNNCFCPVCEGIRVLRNDDIPVTFGGIQ